MSTHLEQSMQRDMDVIRTRCREMAELVEQSLRDSQRAFVERNRQLAYAVVLRDHRIDDFEKEIDRLALEFLVRQQPAAGPLRFAYVTIKINQELERIGDYAESVSRQTLKLGDREIPIGADAFAEMADIVIPMVRDAVRSFLSQDFELARRTMQIEEQANGLRDKLTAALVELASEGKLSIDLLLPLLTMTRRFERVADQAKNICEEVVYMCTGEYSKHRSNDVYRVVFVDADNAGLSQMAELIASSLNLKRFIFSSAGLRPRMIDPRLSSAIAEEGGDASRVRSKGLDQIPNLDHYQLYIGLTAEARKVFPAPPSKAVGLDWSIPDPFAPEVSGDAFPQQFKTAWKALKEHILELTSAIEGKPVGG